MVRRTPLLVCLGCVLAFVTGSAPEARADDSSVVAAQEAALAPGVLPAWETQAERARPKVRRPVAPSPFPPPAPPAPGYRVPAEFEPVAAFLVTEGDWMDGSWGSDVQMLINMIKQGTVAEGAGAIVMTRGTVSSYESYLEGRGVDLSRVHVVHASAGLDAKWARDFGPLSILEGGEPGHLAFGDLHYYDTRERDDAVAGQLAAELGIARYGLEGNDQSPADAVKLYMEGGNFMTDGRGTCILSNDIASDNAKNGNTQADTQQEVEEILGAYLNCQKLIWLTPMPNNSTGHVDMYAKLLTPTDILMIDFPSQTGANGVADAVVEANVEVMQSATNLAGQPFTVHRVVVPALSNSYVYRTYTNSTIINHVALVPTYGYSSDAAALQAYRDVLGSDYTVTGIDSSDIVAMGGAVHCTTMQIASACGDGKAERLLFEACDGADLAGATCQSLGLGDGQLGCKADCELDTTGCGGATEPQPEAGIDAAAEAQADAEPDAGSDAEALESGDGLDAGEEDARAALPDGGGDEPPIAAPTDDGGCSCSAAGGMRAGSGAAGWLTLVALATRRRRGINRRAARAGRAAP